MIRSIRSVPFGDYRANCYALMSGGQTLVVDPGAEPGLLLDWLGDVSVAAIVLTHCHSDHIGVVNEVVAATGAPVWCGRQDVAALADPHLSGFDEVGLDYRVTGVGRGLKDGDMVEWGDHGLRVLEVPGHTPGSICLVDDDIIVTGDTLFAQGIGRSDFIRGNGTDLERSLARIGSLPSGLEILPGHGARSTLGVEKERDRFLGGNPRSGHTATGEATA